MVIGSLLIVMDRKDGYQERAFVAGVKPLEILSGHMLTCFVAVLSQVFLTLMLSFVILELDNEGSLLEIFILIFLQGIQGLSIGLVISTICVNEIFASVSFFKTNVNPFNQCSNFLSSLSSFFVLNIYRLLLLV